MKKTAYILLVIVALCLTSCGNYDSWTTSTSAKLVFSQDTVAFDTCITTVPSSTKTLLVYNDNKDGIRITTVRLNHGASSIFRVNVDGQYLAGGSSSDFEIRGEDSIFVRLEVTVPEAPSDAYLTETDSLIFLLESGVIQYVPLTVTGQNGEFQDSLVIHSDTTLQNIRPIIIKKGITVENGAKLTLQAGTRLYFHDQSILDVENGSLVCNGTMEKPVVLRGDRTDHLFDYLPYDNTPNRWFGIILGPKSHDNVLTYTDVHSGTYGIQADSTSLILHNCIIYNMGMDGVVNFMSKIKADNTQISNCGGTILNILGGETELDFCTLAQFYLYGSTRGDALYLADNSTDESYPITKAQFRNCVITGYAEDVINASLTGEEIQDETRTDILFFQNCMLATVTNDTDQRFQNCLYDKKDKIDPDRLVRENNFTLFDAKNYIYDFTPKKESRIHGLADPDAVAQYPKDRLGRIRNTEDKAYAGAYEGEQE